MDLLYPNPIKVYGIKRKFEQLLKLAFIVVGFFLLGSGGMYLYMLSNPITVSLPVPLPIPVSDADIFLNESANLKNLNKSYFFVVDTDIGSILHNNITISDTTKITGDDKMCNGASGFWQVKQILSNVPWLAWNVTTSNMHLSISLSEYFFWSRSANQIIELRYNRETGTLWEMYIQFPNCLSDTIDISVTQVMWW